jgi:hypothetical protein
MVLYYSPLLLVSNYVISKAQTKINLSAKNELDADQKLLED